MLLCFHFFLQPGPYAMEYLSQVVNLGTLKQKVVWPARGAGALCVLACLVDSDGLVI